jgi:uncharacterized protein YndB with AHSA1/START domain
MIDSAASRVRAIERQITVQQPPGRVWSALTDPAELSKWFGNEASVDLRAGGAATLSWTPGHADGGTYFARIDLVEPMTRLAYTWARDAGTAVDDGPNTMVEYDLEPVGDGGTLLRLRESGFASEEDRAANDAGWSEELGELGAHLASARP